MSIEIRTEPCWANVGVLGAADRSCAELERVVHCINCSVFRNAGREMFDRDLLADQRMEWTERVATPPETEQQSTASHLVFQVGGEWFALPTATCEEVVDPSPVHRIPHRTSALEGVVNVHGRLEICIDLMRLLSIDRREAAESSRMIVLADPKGRYVVRVDAVHGVVRHASSALREPPAAIRCREMACCEGLLRIDDREVSALDPVRLSGLVGECLA